METLRPLLSTPGRLNPHRIYQQLRPLGPVTVTSRGWLVVTGLPECDRILSDPVFRVTGAQRGLGHTLLGNDGETHRFLRQGLAGEFSRTAVARLRPVVTDAAKQAAESLAEALHRDGQADVVEHIAAVPAAVIGAWASIPDQDQRPLARTAGHAHQLMEVGWSRSKLNAAADAFDQLVAYFSARATTTDPDRMCPWAAGWTPEQLDGNLALLAAAANITTSGLIATCVALLTRNPELTDAVATDERAATALVQEALRMDGPAQVTARVASEDTTVADVPVRAGSPVLLLLGATGADQRYVADPDVVDLNRHNGPPVLGFGGGPHRCLGARLAMTEAAEAVTAVARLGRLTTTVCEQRGLLSARGPKRLLVRRAAA